MPVDSPILGWGLPDEDTALEPLNHYSTALQSSMIVKTGPGILYGLTVTSTKAASQYLLVFDAASLPADGAIPILAKSVPANDAVGFSWLPGRTFLVGIVVCNSTTNTSKTLGLADCFFDCQFV